MKMELPCDIIKDLLPNYIDGLSSETTNDSVTAHLEHCKECYQTYNSMKADYEKPACLPDTKESKEEKTLFLKLKGKLQKKIRVAIACGILACLLVFISFQLLFNIAWKEVDSGEVSVSAACYSIKELATQTIASSDEFQGVVISSAGNSENVYGLKIPALPNCDIQIDESTLESCEYVTAITFQSPYILRTILWEYETVGDETILYIDHYKTTCLKNRTDGGEHVSSTFHFDKLNKIIYRQNDGTELLLWENEMK